MLLERRLPAVAGPPIKQEVADDKHSRRDKDQCQDDCCAAGSGLQCDLVSLKDEG